MPNKKSAKKRMRQNEKRMTRNRQAKAALKTAITKVERLIEGDNPDLAKKEFTNAVKIIGKTAQKGIIHPRNAQRKESRLAKKINTLSKKA